METRARNEQALQWRAGSGVAGMGDGDAPNQVNYNSLHKCVVSERVLF